MKQKTIFFGWIVVFLLAVFLFAHDFSGVGFILSHDFITGSIIAAAYIVAILISFIMAIVNVPGKPGQVFIRVIAPVKSHKELVKAVKDQAKISLQDVFDRIDHVLYVSKKPEYVDGWSLTRTNNHVSLSMQITVPNDKKADEDKIVNEIWNTVGKNILLSAGLVFISEVVEFQKIDDSSISTVKIPLIKNINKIIKLENYNATN